jgi:hypothetical protein
MAMVVETVAAMETAMVAATAAAVPQAKPDLSVPPPCMRRVARLLPQDGEFAEGVSLPCSLSTNAIVQRLHRYHLCY